MTVYDRWHRTHPPEDAKPCGCSRGKTKLYPSRDHEQGDRWQVRWYDENGKQCKRNRPKKEGNDPETCADAFDALITSQLNAGTYIDPNAGQILLRAFAEDWRAGLVADPSTLETLDRRLKHVYGAPIAVKPLRWLSKNPHALQQWIKSLEAKDLGPGYIRILADTLSQVFNAALDNGLISTNPMRAKSVKPPPIPKKRVVPWTRQMVDAAAAELQRRYAAGAMVYLGAGAGLRVSEVFGIAEEDIVFLGAERRILVRRQVKLLARTLVFAPPKRGKTREVPLSDELAARLAARIADRPPAEVSLPWRTPGGKPHSARLLFVDRVSGDPWYKQAFDWTWNRCRAAAGAPPPPDEGGVFHALRHTFASACLFDGVDVRALADWLGHEDPGFTLRTYTHLMPKASDKGRRAIDRFLGGGETPGTPVDLDASARNMP